VVDTKSPILKNYVAEEQYSVEIEDHALKMTFFGKCFENDLFEL
jgi:hypothetical protein